MIEVCVEVPESERKKEKSGVEKAEQGGLQLTQQPRSQRFEVGLLFEKLLRIRILDHNMTLILHNTCCPSVFLHPRQGTGPTEEHTSLF